MQDVMTAIGELQRRSLKEWRASASQLLDIALDDLVANPHRVGDTRHLTGSAIARARTRVANRMRIAPVVGTLDDVARPLPTRRRTSPPPAQDDGARHACAMLMDALDRGGLAERDRRYAVLSWLGFTPREVAAADGDPVDVVRVRMSRARARAREVVR